MIKFLNESVSRRSLSLFVVNLIKCLKTIVTDRLFFCNNFVSVIEADCVVVVNRRITQLVKITYVICCTICYHLCNSKNVKNTHGGVLLFVKLQALKVTFLHGCFSRFLNCANGTKSRKAHLSISWIFLFNYSSCKYDS